MCHLPASGTGATPTDGPGWDTTEADLQQLADVEMAYIRHVTQVVNGNQSTIARRALLSLLLVAVAGLAGVGCKSDTGIAAPAFSVSSMAPAFSPQDSRTQITITGEGFDAGTVAVTGAGVVATALRSRLVLSGGRGGRVASAQARGARPRRGRLVFAR